MGADVIGLGTEPLPRSGTVYGPTATTATHTESLSIQQSGADDLMVVIDFVKVGAAPSVVFKIQGVVTDNTGKKITFDLLTSAAITSTQVLVLQISDRLLAVTNLAANDIVPDHVQIVCTHANSDVATYSIIAVLAP